MSVQATITLNRLRCIAESDRGGTEHSEPYVWPFLASVAMSPGSFATTPPTALQFESRKILRNEMRAGQSAALEGPGNRLMAEFLDDQTRRHLVLIVGLLESDDMTAPTMQKCYQVYLDELRLQLGHNALALAGGTVEEMDQIVAQVTKQVSAKVFAAIKDSVSTGDKVEAFLGRFSPDDFVSASFKCFRNVAPAAMPTAFTLQFNGISGDPKLVFKFGGHPSVQAIEFLVHYELDCNLMAKHFVPDPCQAKIDGVDAAVAAIALLQAQVISLKAQLVHATPQQRPGIIAQIDEVNSKSIPAAEQVLDRTQRSLRLCRLGAPVDQPGVVPELA